MTSRPRSGTRWFVLAALVPVFLLLAGRPAVHAAPDPPPKLIVLLVVDQMRTDYIDRFHHQWSSGLRRLVDQGAWFRQAAYPYLTTVTCAGHATISTGGFPRTHGLMQNSWWSREAGQMVSCTNDPQAPSIGHGPRPVAGGGHGPHLLQAPALADELRFQLGTGARVVSLALKARSAIMMAGREADIALWLDDAGVWATSAAYASKPIPFVEEFVGANPIERDFGKTWTRALPDDAYLYEDDGLGETPPSPWTATFPHLLKGEGREPDDVFYRLWRYTPHSDEYLAEMAAAAVERLELGRGQGTDLLAIGFSALDSIGHNFGPRSHEVQDMLVRLDRTIGGLLGDLDRLVGAGQYVVALSADHGVGPIPEQAAAAGLDAGRVPMQLLTTRLQQALADRLGSDRHVAAVVHTDIYLAPGVYGRLAADPAAMEAALEAIRTIPGVARVFRSDDLRDHRTVTDPVARAAAMSYVPGRSGDLILVPKPYWITSPAAATHGTSRLYDARVPVVFYGRGVRPGVYLEPSSPADIAPTLALLAGVTLPQPDGRVLREALATEPVDRPPTAACP